MARAKTPVRDTHTRSASRSNRNQTGGGRRRRVGLAPKAYRGLQLSFVPLTVLLAPALAIGLSSYVRDQALQAMGYGVALVWLWTACMAFVLRHKRHWPLLYWKLLVGSALVTLVTLGILGMFKASGGVMEDASLGGDGGRILGGTPVALGILKLTAIALVSPLILFPRRAGMIYKRASLGTLIHTKIGLAWLGTHLRDTIGPAGSRFFKAVRKLLKRHPKPSSVFVDMPDVEPALEPAIYDADIDLEVTSEPVPEDLEAVPSIVEEEKRPVVGALGWQLPSNELLSKSVAQTSHQTAQKQMAKHIEETLAQHRVEVTVQDIRTGPRVIRFGLVPGWTNRNRENRSNVEPSLDVESSRVKVQSILAREKDLALALKTSYLRMEAPVPGEALVGLEVPNPHPRKVVLRAVTESAAFKKVVREGGLPIALGEDTGGEPVVADLTGLPHLLIAGATGSGKSVCINAIVGSLLLTCRPDKLRMLMVDPKRVELTPFNGVPYLIAPVIVDTEEVLVVLRAVQNEMMRRYKLMENMGVRNIEGYNRKAKESMPFLVVIIDELADLMMSAAYEAEQSLVRLAQLGRATGIHLILATQRPSVNVVTGLLKANIPARIAFAVASQVDSRVILDAVGAEKLLGKGDMLLLSPASPKPTRVQGTFVDDREIEKLVEFWHAQSGPPLAEIPMDKDPKPEAEGMDEDDQKLLNRARDLAQRTSNLSPSVLQRRLQIGHSKAVTLMQALEDEDPGPDLDDLAPKHWRTD